MSRFLILRLDAPLMSFGAAAVDNYGAIARFPALSMVAGLLANALGFDRGETSSLQRLQDRLILASRIEGEAEEMRDFHTAQLGKDDKGWTTRGFVEERAGGQATYDSPHIRYRDFWSNMIVSLAIGLAPATEEPTLETLAEALREPERPLFLGRKPCLPSRPLLDIKPFVEATDVRSALVSVSVSPHKQRKWNRFRIAYQWPACGVSDEDGADRRIETVTDQRLWVAGPHGGERLVYVSEEFVS
jgi:CRISPR system Cascade subunit CasD